MVELLPCPFCGGTDLRLAECNDDSGTWAIECACEAHGPEVEVSWNIAFSSQQREDEAKAKTIELWNRRAPTLFGLPIVEVDDLGDASQIVFGPPLI